MAAPNTAVPSESRSHYWLRVLRPMVWWLLFVLVLFCIHQFQELSNRTRLEFSVLMDGRPVEASAEVDGKAVMNGQLLPIGSHTFTVSHLKAEPYSTNIFMWGERNLGEIILTRQTGVLVVSASPPAATLSVSGPEFSKVYTNSVGISLSVPTDRYTVDARYQYWEKSWDVMVSANSTATLPIMAPLGSVRIGCNRSGASFQILTAEDGRQMQWGDLPAVAVGLPEGNYTIAAQYHGDKREKLLSITAGATNDIRIAFVYGSAVLETDPSGASVRTGDGRDWGVTPLNVSELKPGHWEFTLQLQGYEPALAALEITADETNSFQTNLVNQLYHSGMESARQYMSSGQFQWAAQAAKQALQAAPGDAQANALLHEASGREYILDAENHVKQGNYSAASNELASAMALLPDDAHAEEVRAELKKGEQDRIERDRQAQAEREHQERLAVPQKAFATVMQRLHNVGQLFPEHKVTANLPVSEVESALLEALTNEEPRFVTERVNNPFPNAFGFVASQRATDGGLRQCAIAGAQTGDHETRLIFRVIEYRVVQNLNVSGLLNGQGNTSLIVLDGNFRGQLTEEEKLQIQEGTPMVLRRIVKVTAHVPTGSP